MGAGTVKELGKPSMKITRGGVQDTRTEFQELVQKPIAERFAASYGYQSGDEVAKVLRDTVLPKGCTDSEFSAFLTVAEKYRLNPFLRQIYAFPKKAGGLQVIVPIDGWIGIANDHPQYDGYETSFDYGTDGALFSCTVVVHRKDRTHPSPATEKLSECKRNTDPWKMEHRMLKHRAFMQAARYAFGVSGIMEEDEYQQMMESGAAIEGGGVEDLAEQIKGGGQAPLIMETVTKTIEEVEEEYPPGNDYGDTELGALAGAARDRTKNGPRLKSGLYSNPVVRIHQLRALVKEFKDEKHFSDKLCQDCTGFSKKRLKEADASGLEKLWRHLAGDDADAHHLVL